MERDEELTKSGEVARVFTPAKGDEGLVGGDIALDEIPEEVAGLGVLDGAEGGGIGGGGLLDCELRNVGSGGEEGGFEGFEGGCGDFGAAVGKDK